MQKKKTQQIWVTCIGKALAPSTGVEQTVEWDNPCSIVNFSSKFGIWLWILTQLPFIQYHNQVSTETASLFYEDMEEYVRLRRRKTNELGLIRDVCETCWKLQQMVAGCSSKKESQLTISIGEGINLDLGGFHFYEIILFLCAK